MNQERTLSYPCNVVQSKKRGGFLRFVFMIFICLILFTMFSNIDLYMAEFQIYNAEATMVQDGVEHAIERHGAEAQAVLQCSNQKAPLQIWKKDDRHAIVLCMDDGKFALHIKCGDKTITAFIKNKMQRLEQIAKYLENRMYIRVQ